jgi:hypothetical protein
MRAALAILALAAVLASTPGANPRHAIRGGPANAIEVFRATTVRLPGFTSSSDSLVQSWGVRIAIERWSTASERDTLIAALKSGRAAAVLAALRGFEPPAASLVLSPPLLFGNDGQESIHTEIAYAVDRTRADGGRRIQFLAVPQPTPGAPPSLHWIELVLEADGSGEGFEALGCELGLNANGSDIELKAAAQRRSLVQVRAENIR